MPSVRPKGRAFVLSFRDYAVNIHCILLQRILTWEAPNLQYRRKFVHNLNWQKACNHRNQETQCGKVKVARARSCVPCWNFSFWNHRYHVQDKFRLMACLSLAIPSDSARVIYLLSGSAFYWKLHKSGSNPHQLNWKLEVIFRICYWASFW